MVIVDKKTRKVIYAAFCKGKNHDFRLYKESNVLELFLKGIAIEENALDYILR